MCHRVFEAFSFIKGEQMWNFEDFQTTEGIMRIDGNKKGIFTRNRPAEGGGVLFQKTLGKSAPGLEKQQEQKLTHIQSGPLSAEVSSPACG
jgi:hypothetical protein